MDSVKTKAKLIDQFVKVSARIARLEIQLEDAKNEHTFLKRQINRESQFPMIAVDGKSYSLTSQERDYVSGGNVIEAIKSLRSRTNLGLKDAKDIVDQYRGITY